MLLMPTVIYIDMDYFFAACEELRHPELKGKTFVVGTSPFEDRRIRGVVQTCNYETRKLGIHSAMPLIEAFKIKPDLTYLPEDSDYYEATSKKIADLLRAYGFRMEMDSIDEVAMDTADTSYEKAAELAKEMKSKINGQLGLPCTVGVSFGKTFAKMACDEAKPNGLKIVTEAQVREFLSPKEVGKIPGVGKKIGDRLRAMGFDTIGKLSKANPVALFGEFGEVGKYIFLIANGTETEKIVENDEALSIGRERAVFLDPNNSIEIGEMLRKLSEEAAAEVRKQNLLYKTITLKVRYNDFTTHIKSSRLNHYSNSVDMLYDTVVGLSKHLDMTKEINKIGVRVSTLISMKGQNTLF
jgi:nucleotidyltransferase/DNA polymerase involved in DNA repair